jgi:hypothetical protein
MSLRDLMHTGIIRMASQTHPFRGYLHGVLSQASERRHVRNAVLHDVMGRLQEAGLGSLKVSDNLHVFGLTAVVPWAVPMLALIRPNCAMLDATFRILKPYVLEILSLIFARCSASGWSAIAATAGAAAGPGPARASAATIPVNLCDQDLWTKI